MQFEKEKSLFALRIILRPAVLILATTAVYFRGLFGGLLLSWDDDRFIVNSDVTNNVSIDSLVSIFSQQYYEAYHPLHLLSYWLDVPWFGHGGPAIHIVSLCLWIVTLFILLKLFDKIGLSPMSSLIAVLFFGLHPVQVEAVTWATGRKDILAALFSGLALLSHINVKTGLDRHAWLSRIFYILAALSKTTTLPLPVLFILYDILIKKISIRNSLLRQLPLILIACSLASVVVLIWDNNVMIRPDTIAGPVTRIAASISHHCVTAIMPINTAAIYPVNRPSDFMWYSYIIPLAIMATILLSLKYRQSRVVFILLSFLALLLPVSNIVPMYWHWMDRYLSLPLLPLALGIGFLLTRLTKVKKTWITVLGFCSITILLIAFSARTAVHHIRYTDDMSLWTHTVQAQPEAFNAWKKYGEQLIKAKKPDAAINSFHRAILIEPNNKLANAHLAQAYALHDEQKNNLKPSRIDTIGLTYLKHSNIPERLLKFARLLDTSGYEKTTTFFLERAFKLSKKKNKLQLIMEAQRHKKAGRTISSEFYMNKMNTLKSNSKDEHIVIPAQ